MPHVTNSKNWELVLWLDLGTASVGWSLISFQNWDSIFLDAWVKIFQEPVEPKSWTPKNHKRRDARGTRKNLARKAMRKHALRHTLENHSIPIEWIGDSSKNPYEIRSRGLSEKLSLSEIGVALYHFVQKRGFLSNRKWGKSDEKWDVYGSITTIEQQMEEYGVKTLWEYRLKELNEKWRFEFRYTSRKMYEAEFDMFWTKQAWFYHDILTENLRSEIRNHIFFQRPLKIQKNLVGECIYYKNRKRAQKASLLAQEFLVWQDINNLKYKRRGTYEFQGIPLDRKKMLAEILMQKWSMTFWVVRKELKLWDDIIFNFEKWNKTGLSGNTTTSKILWKWEGFINLTREQQDMFITDLLTIEREDSLLERIKNHWKINESIAKEIANTELASDYIGLSEKAIKKILPVMKETGENYRTIAENLKKAGKFPEERNIYAGINPWTDVPPLRNPIVQKSITEARKVIKAIKNIYGTPTLIRIEMARDMKNTEKEKQKIQKKQNENKKNNDKTKEELISEWIQNPGYEDILKLNLYKECGGFCPYTGKPISRSQLFSSSSEIDIEHIIPYSRSLDDSFMNKTLCYADFNRAKKLNLTPWELWQKDPEWYEQVMKRIDGFPWGKKKRFEQKEVDTDEFISRQLNDTRYICKEIKTFSEALIGKDRVEVTKWWLTGLLRHSWGWNRFIIEEWGDENKKNRTDHRHHSIDATIIALTSRSLLKHASEQFWSHGDREKISELYSELKPTKSFEEGLEKKLSEMIISHTATHKIRGWLHEETGYGKILDPETNLPKYVVRKKLTDKFSEKDLPKIVDITIRTILAQYLKENGQFSEKNPPIHKDKKTPILSVRMKEDMSNMYDYRGEWELFFTFWSNHHVEILEHREKKNKDDTPKRAGIFVTMWEANRRAKEKESIVNKLWPWINELKEETYNPKEWKCIFSLSANDMVRYYPDPKKKEEYKLCRVQKMSGAKNQITLRDMLESWSDPKWEIQTSPNLLTAEKIQVDPLGNITLAND